MAPSIGLNLRVTGYCNQGGRKYMEDVFSVAYQQTEDEKDLEYAFFGIFDGHGGREAAVFAKEHLMDFIVRQKSFWAEDDESVLRAIREGFMQTHQAMWKELENWPKTASGLPSTAGTTASIAFIRRGKIFIGHVGDSAIVLGVQHPDNPHVWTPKPLTRDHKPESVEESRRIQQSGGKVVCKSGVPRVVWNRPKVGHRGMVRRSTHIDEIPFLAVARSLGDLWSYNSEEDVFVVSPEPDTFVYPIDISKHRCLILGTDGAWNMMTPAQAVLHVCQAEKSNEQHMLYPSSGRQWINPSKRLVDRAIERWNQQNLRADNTSVVTVMLDPPGPPRAQVLKRQRELAQLNQGRSGITSNHVNADRGSVALVTNTTPEDLPEQAPPTPMLPPIMSPPPTPSFPPFEESNPATTSENSGTISQQPQISTPKNPAGISIISRFPNSRNEQDAKGHNLAETAKRTSSPPSSSSLPTVETSSKILHDFQVSADRSRRRLQEASTTTSTSASGLVPNQTGNRAALNRLADSSAVLSRSLADSSSGLRHLHHFINRHHHHHNNVLQRQNSSSTLTTATASTSQQNQTEGDIQCNEISSSDDDSTPTKGASRSALPPLPPALPARKGILKESRLSRELSALQLDSPHVTNQASRRHRKRSHSANTSDAENENVEDSNRSRRLRSASGGKPLSDVELKCHELNAKIRNMERKVAQKTQQLDQEVRLLKSTLMKTASSSHFLRSSTSTPTMNVERKTVKTTSPRSLRPRSGVSTPVSCSSLRKRKLSAGPSSRCSESTSAKSPRRSLTSVPIQKKPIMTRSRKARVLQLKK